MTNSILFLFLMTLATGAAGKINYVQNGGFEDPSILNNVITKTNIPYWMGNFDLFGSEVLSELIGTQIIDLATTKNGFIQQNVTLPFNGTYLLSFVGKDRASNSTIINESAAEVYWNQKLVSVCSPPPMNIMHMSIQVNAKSGSNNLRFVEIGSNNSIGLFLDNVSLYFIKQ